MCFITKPQIEDRKSGKEKEKRKKRKGKGKEEYIQ